MMLQLRGAETSEIGDLIREAMRRKGEALGKRYTFRELEADTGVNYAYAARVANGERQPSRAMVRAIWVGLRPYLSLEEAMVAAGYVEPDKQHVLSRLARRSRRALEAAEDYLAHHWSEADGPNDEADDERDEDGDAGFHQDTPHP